MAGQLIVNVCSRRHGNLLCLFAQDARATYRAYLPKMPGQLIVPICPKIRGNLLCLCALDSMAIYCSNVPVCLVWCQSNLLCLSACFIYFQYKYRYRKSLYLCNFLGCTTSPVLLNGRDGETALLIIIELAIHRLPNNINLHLTQNNPTWLYLNFRGYLFPQITDMQGKDDNAKKFITFTRHCSQTKKFLNQRKKVCNRFCQKSKPVG